jgi:endonuclease YncB( thermonuclease family)
MLYRSNVKQRASSWTLFVFIALTIFSPALFANSCAISQPYESVHVARVYDGDTLKLTDGRKIRLIGINTPEHGSDGNKDEPFYQQAKNQLQQIIQKSHHQIKMVLGSEKHDRYQRLLAHIYTMDNENITATLIKSGMGYTIAIPPNIQRLTCYQDAEREAQNQKRGIWAHNSSRIIDVTSLKKSLNGFQRISGTVYRVGESRSSFWLNLNSKSKFALRIPKDDLSYFEKFHPNDLLNRHIVARGWINKTNGEQRMTIHHPAALQIQNAD